MGDVTFYFKEVPEASYTLSYSLPFFSFSYDAINTNANTTILYPPWARYHSRKFTCIHQHINFSPKPINVDIMHNLCVRKLEVTDTASELQMDTQDLNPMSFHPKTAALPLVPFTFIQKAQQRNDHLLSDVLVVSWITAQENSLAFPYLSLFRTLFV